MPTPAPAGDGGYSTSVSGRSTSVALGQSRVDAEPATRDKESGAHGLDPDRCPICGAAARFAARHPQADLYRCGSCTHRYSVVSDPASYATYDEAYYEESQRNWFSNPNISLFTEIADEIAAQGEAPSVVDVGCGRGDFLRFLRDRLPSASLTGFDLSANAPAPGIEFLQVDAVEHQTDRTFDVVVSLAVIEHVEAVEAFAAALRRLCRPGGLAVVMTVDDGSLIYQAARLGRRLGVPIAFDRLYEAKHLHHFTTRSLRHLLEHHGLRTVRVVHHNTPLAAVDTPVRSRFVDAGLRTAVGLLYAAGRMTGRTFLQTVICRAPS